MEAKATSSLICSKCEKNLESIKIVKGPQENHNLAKGMVKCDHCDKNFNEKWKLNAHLKTCKVNKCHVCDKTFKYTDLLKKHKLIAHKNFKIYCHFFNNEKSCPNKECVFLHEDSTMCKYDSVCERQYCMYKHGLEKESDENEFDRTVNENGIIEESNVDKNQEESDEEITLKNTIDQNEECGNIIIVDVEILNDQVVSMMRLFVKMMQ